MKKLTQRPLPSGLKNYFYDFDNTRMWKKWEKLEYIPPEDGAFNKIFVPTEQSFRYNYILKQMISI
jgi:hypothetical protein